jgi:photosynthetic reaction center H-chain
VPHYGTGTPYIYKGGFAKRLKPAFGHGKKQGQTRASVLSAFVKAWPFAAFAISEKPKDGVALAYPKTHSTAIRRDAKSKSGF